MTALEQLQEWFRPIRTNPRRRLPRVECADGFTMSVQVGDMVYCSPRDNYGPWNEVEIGFPNRVEPLLFNYAEEPLNWTETVYPYVPIELVAVVVEVHGGFATVSDT